MDQKKRKATNQKNKKLVKQFRDMGLAPEEVEELLRVQEIEKGGDENEKKINN